MAGQGYAFMAGAFGAMHEMFADERKHQMKLSDDAMTDARKEALLELQHQFRLDEQKARRDDAFKLNKERDKQAIELENSRYQHNLDVANSKGNWQNGTVKGVDGTEQSVFFNPYTKESYTIGPDGTAIKGGQPRTQAEIDQANQDDLNRQTDARVTQDLQSGRNPAAVLRQAQVSNPGWRPSPKMEQLIKEKQAAIDQNNSVQSNMRRLDAGRRAESVFNTQRNVH